jgi:pimeloyl-ACP methyl ester carboxylesterase
VILKRMRRRLACRLALYSERGLAFLQCAAPLSSLAYLSAMPRQVLVVFLPGIGDFAEDFESRGFLESLGESGLEADAIAVDAHYGYYARRSLHERLAQDVVLPARSRGSSEIWLVGISMGGIGALSYAVHHPGHIARALLLAPYLGESQWVRELTERGTDVPPDRDDARAHVQRPWRWIRDQHREETVGLRLYLGYGTRDRFAEANALFGRHLLPGHVLSVRGGHDWRTWKTLWDRFLAMWAEEAHQA